LVHLWLLRLRKRKRKRFLLLRNSICYIVVKSYFRRRRSATWSPLLTDSLNQGNSLPVLC
jgi:hypothetical protein